MKTLRWSLVLSGTAVALMGCSDDGRVGANADVAPLKVAAGRVTRAASFPMSWAPPAGFSPADTAHRVAGVMGGGTADLSVARFEQTGGRFTSNGKRWVGDDTWNDRVGELRVKYYPQFNDLRLSNDRLRSVADGPDVGQEAAKKQFLAVLDQLGQTGVIRNGDYDLATVKVSTTKFGSAPAGETATPVVIEYVFTLLRNINGIPLANAGVRISVHRSGAISGIRLGGVTVAAKAATAAERALGIAEAPASGGRMFDVAVAREQVQARFAQEFPRARKIRDEMMYVMPDAADTAVVHPRYVVSYSNRYATDEGEVVARRKSAAYSVVDAMARAEDISESAKPEDVGDPR
jgi:hypothetical protein